VLSLLLAATVSSVGAPQRLSLDEALAEADRGAAVLVARAEADVGRREAQTVRVPASPVVSVGTTRYSERESLSASQEVRWGGERASTVRAAEERAGAAEANAAGAAIEARRLVRGAWIALAAAEDAEALARAAAGRAGEVVAIVKARFDGGRVPRLELVRAEAEAARVGADAEALGESRRAAWSRLATLLGRDPASEGRTDEARSAPLPDADLAALADGGVASSNPAVVAGERNLAAARAAREASRRRLLPGLAFTVGVNADDPGLPGPDYQGSVSLTLPFGSRGPSAVRLAEAGVRLEEARLVEVRRRVAEELAVASRRVRAARARLEALERAAVPAAEEAASLTREAYEAGRGDVLRVIDAERSLFEARASRDAAWAEEKSAEADLIAAAGKETE